jgi:choline dehydrogenase
MQGVSPVRVVTDSICVVEANEYLPPDTPGHGYNGYVNTTISDPSFMKQNSDVQKLANQLIKVTGGDAARDINAPDPDRDQVTGVFGMASHADKNGKRAGTNTYLKSTLADPRKFNLTIQLETLVTRVIINWEDGNPSATGVEVLRGSHQYEVSILEISFPNLACSREKLRKQKYLPLSLQILKIPRVF